MGIAVVLYTVVWFAMESGTGRVGHVSESGAAKRSESIECRRLINGHRTRVAIRMQSIIHVYEFYRKGIYLDKNWADTPIGGPLPSSCLSL